MSVEILVNVTPRETRVALVENGVLQEVFIERAQRRGLVGNIYKGKVSRVLPGMQAAFIEVGLERTAFLHASDIAKTAYAGDEVQEARPADIRELLHEGKELLVQVLKDPLGSKGARLTTRISIPSRYLVYMPDGKGVALSTRIEDEDERNRLREVVEMSIAQSPEQANGMMPGGYIIRTAAEGASLDALRADMMFLNRLWERVRQRSREARAGELVHGDLPLPVRTLRDFLDSDVEQVRVDSRAAWEEMRKFTEMFIPEMTSRIEHYTGDRPIFDFYNVEEEIRRALERKVPLKSGGYLIIDQTEALTTVDVNTGGYVGGRNFGDTIFKTNLEAAVAIARQLRLRNLGGIVIIDFIDMEDAGHRQAVLAELEKALSRDRTRVTISGFSQLGLVEMTRKRTRDSLAHQLCEPCPTCQSRGNVRTPRTVCYEILREILRESRQFDPKEFRILASQAVIDLFLEEESDHLAILGDFIGKPVSLQVETLYSQEQYDIVLI